MIDIVPLARSYSQQVAALHLKYLQTSFHGLAGSRLLALYYSTLADGKGGCCYVALRNTDVIGYVCGVWDAPQVKHQFIRGNRSRIIYWGFLQLLTRPQIMADGIHRLRRGGVSAVVTEGGYELRPIVVSPEERGTGVAGRLVNKLVTDAARRGYAYIHLITEEENYQSNRFYRKNGFSLVQQIVVGGITYNKYQIAITNIPL